MREQNLKFLQSLAKIIDSPSVPVFCILFYIPVINNDLCNPASVVLKLHDRVVPKPGRLEACSQANQAICLLMLIEPLAIRL